MKSIPLIVVLLFTILGSINVHFVSAGSKIVNGQPICVSTYIEKCGAGQGQVRVVTCGPHGEFLTGKCANTDRNTTSCPVATIWDGTQCAGTAISTDKKTESKAPTLGGSEIVALRKEDNGKNLTRQEGNAQRVSIWGAAPVNTTSEPGATVDKGTVTVSVNSQDMAPDLNLDTVSIPVNNNIPYCIDLDFRDKSACMSSPRSNDNFLPCGQILHIVDLSGQYDNLQIGTTLNCSSHQITAAKFYCTSQQILYSCCQLGQVVNNEECTSVSGSIISPIASTSSNVLGVSTTGTPILPGQYEVTSNVSKKVSVTLTNNVTYIKFFIDENGDGIKQSREQFVEGINFNVSVNKLADVTQYNLQEGWNLIAFDLINQNIETAKDVFNLFDLKGALLTHISTYVDGKWITYSRRENDAGNLVDFGENFTIIPGKGYFVKANTKSTPVITGQKFTESVPLDLINGWNLISVQSQMDYTAEAFLTKCSDSGMGCDSIAKFDSGIYSILVSQNELLFGNDFNLIRNNGYFVRVTKGGKLLAI